MKNLTLKLFFLAVLATILFSSCEKEVIYPTQQIPANVPSLGNYSGGISRWGEFLLIDSRKMSTNTVTGVKTQYNDFGNGSRSSLRWGGSLFDVEKIIRDTTIWSFYAPVGIPGNGKFILNHDSTKFYMVSYTRNFTSIIEDPNKGQQNLGGSARPFSSETSNLTDKIVKIYIQTDYAIINGDLCEYFTELTFKKIIEW